jgi:peptidoglycan/LPS O-acetylase OafA/YrhL
VAAIGAVALFLATLTDSGPHPAGGPFKPSSGLSGEQIHPRTLPARAFTAFAYLGQISFGLYVFHILGLMASDYTVQHQDSSLGRYLFRNAVALAVTIVLAAISYRLLESPFLTLKQRFTRVSSR